MIPLSIPSPSEGVWHLGPLPIRGYALCIIAGVVLAVWLGDRRWRQRGGAQNEIGDIAIWAVPFGLVGARLYHVATDHDLYFGAGRHPIEALYIWKGGLGIWGAIAAGVVGAWIVARQRGIRLSSLMDALAPCLLLAQALGRFGNYFNQELYGRPTKLPWGLEISPDHWPEGRTFPKGTTFHPTFLYEAVWNSLGAVLLIWLERRFKIGRGRLFAAYVMVYTAGRFWIEGLRIDTIELNNVAGLRWGQWMAIVLFLLALGYFVRVGRAHPGEVLGPYVEGRGPAAEPEPEPEEEPAAAAVATKTAVKKAPAKKATAKKTAAKKAPAKKTAAKKTTATKTTATKTAAKKAPAKKTAKKTGPPDAG